MKQPTFIIHYSRGEPFRSITSVPCSRWSVVFKNLNENEVWGLARFKDQKYLSQRLDVEKAIRDRFISKGGKPELENPIYFFLGRNSQFEVHKNNIAYKISLNDISSDLISFTYGDSMLAFNEENRILSGEKYQNFLCTKIFRLEDLEALYSHSFFPKIAPLHIEAQLWVKPSTKIVKKLL